MDFNLPDGSQIPRILMRGVTLSGIAYQFHFDNLKKEGAGLNFFLVYAINFCHST